MSALPNNLKESYTMSEALAIRDIYQHLAGMPYVENGEPKGQITNVVISPFDEINKWVFLQHYMESWNADKALEYYKAPFYDVILIISVPELPIFYVQAAQYVRDLQSSSFTRSGMTSNQVQNA
jgi:hypothetical protein